MQLAFGAAGAFIGSFFGMASIGWSIGSFLGGQLQGKDDVQLPAEFGPRLGDLKVQTSTYGNMIPIAFGTVRIAGNIIWAPPITEHVTTETASSGGGKGDEGGGATQTRTTYSYTADFAIAICEGPIIGIRKIWGNGKLIFDIGETSNPMSVLASTNAMTVYTGSESQTADPTMEADHPGLTPAYRGTAYAMFNDLPLEQFGNRIPNLEFEVVVSGASGLMVPTALYTLPSGNKWAQGNDQFQAARNTPNAAYLWVVKQLDGSPQGIAQEAALYNNFTGQIVTRKVSDTGTMTMMGVGPTSRGWVQQHGIGANAGEILGISINGDTLTYTAFGAGDDSNRLERLYECPWASDDPIDDPVFYVQYNHPSAGVKQVFRMNGLELVSPGEHQRVEFAESADRIDGRLYIVATGVAQPTLFGTIGWVDGGSNEFTAVKVYDQSAQPHATIGLDGYIYARSVNIGQADVLEKLTADGVLVDSVALTGLSPTDYSGTTDRMVQDAFGNMIYQRDTQLWRINYGTMEIEATAELADLNDWILGGDTFQGQGVLVIRVEAGEASPNNVVRVLVDTLTSDPPPLSAVVSALCLRTGLVASDIDVTALASTDVAGYVISRRASVRAMIEPLMGAFFFDAVESDNKIKFVMRGGALAVTIPEDDLSAHTGEAAETPDQLRIVRKQEMELPVEVNVAYLNKAIDYQVSQQPSRRLITEAEQTFTLTVPIVLTDDQAKRIADTQIYSAWLERESFEFETSRKYSKYEPTDLFAVVKSGVSHGLRVTNKDDGADGIIKWRGVADLTYVYAQTSAGAAVGIDDAEILIIGPTEITLMDTPLLRDADDQPGFYYGASGVADGWRGTQLYASRDSGVTYQTMGGGLLLSESSVGHSTNALGSYPDTDSNERFDEYNTVTVVMRHGSLASATDLQVLNGANAAMLGDEIIQFRTATLTDTDTYTLSGFLRGRLGSESSMGDHATVEAFVLLDANLGNAAQVLADRNRVMSVKPVSVGATLAQTSAVFMTNTMRRLKTLSPWHVKAGKNSEGDWIIEWVRRSRYRSAGWSIPLGENVERYEVDILDTDNATVLGTLIASAPTVTYSAAEQAIFGASSHTLRALVYQVSDRVGRGHPSQYLEMFDRVTHAYWRIKSVGLPAAGTFLEISEIQLLDGGVNVTSLATKTCNPAPDGEALANLFDGNLSTRCYWTKANAELGAFAISFDFSAGAARTITGIKQGGYDDSTRYMTGFTVEYSDDNAAWFQWSSASGLSYPGNNTLSSEYSL